MKLLSVTVPIAERGGASTCERQKLGDYGFILTFMLPGEADACLFVAVEAAWCDCSPPLSDSLEDDHVSNC